MNSLSQILMSPIASLIKKIDQVFQTDHLIRLINRKSGFHSPEYDFQKDQFAFVHVPKTGGTSISAILEKMDRPEQFINLHMHRPISKHCPPDSYKYFTILRDPVARVYSYYKMAERKDLDNPYGHLCGQGLEHFMSHCWETRNMCCRYLSGEVKKEVDEKSYQRACDNLLNFKYVGLFENFEDSMKQLLEIFSPSKIEIPHHRRSARVLPSPEECKLIEKYNQYDIRLYDFYRERADATSD